MDRPVDDSHPDETPGARISGSQQQRIWDRCKPPPRHLSGGAGVNSSSVYAVLIVAFGAFAYKDNRLGIKLKSVAEPSTQAEWLQLWDISRPTAHFFILGPPVETGFSIHVQ